MDTITVKFRSANWSWVLLICGALLIKKEIQISCRILAEGIYTECTTPIDFFFWPVKCIKTKKIDIKLHLFSSLVTTISLSGTNLNRNTFFDLLFES